MQYIINYLAFVLDDKRHLFLFNHTDFIDGRLKAQILTSICEYLNQLTAIEIPSIDGNLTYEEAEHILLQFKVSIGFSLCLGFERNITDDMRWIVNPHEEEKPSLEDEDATGDLLNLANAQQSQNG